MYDIQDPFPHILLFRKWRSALLSELACFAYARNLLRGKVRESEYDSFRLHVLKLLKFDMTKSLVPQEFRSDSALRLFANMADFTSFDARINI